MHLWSKIISCYLFLLLFSRLYGQQATDKILELYNIVNFSYVDSINQHKLIDGAIQGILEELDPHSVYIPKDQVDEVNESLNGSFEGIGIQFQMYRDTVLVVSPISGGPSEELGIRSGDKILKADDKPISGIGLNDDQVISTLRGKKGSQVKISVLRIGVDHVIDYLITRDNIPIYSVDVAYFTQPGTGYIKINRFSKTTIEEFRNAVKKLKEENLTSLILDLRGNGGGFLHSAVEIADEFIDSKDVIVTTNGLRQRQQIYRATPNGLFTDGNLIVLIDEGSASASEILAGAIQDLDRGIIIGRRSFGKGLVMKPYMLSDGSMVRLTTSRYFTPSGRCIQKDYRESRDSYENEITSRFENGEFFTPDSIDFPDSLTYNTSVGRKVYGGGGIFPDIFVPVDSLLLDSTYQRMIRSGAFPGFAIEYVQGHRMELIDHYKTEYYLINDTNLSKELFVEFKGYLKNKQILSAVPASILHEKLVLQLKAFIARNLWDDSSYHKVINHNQPVILKAHEILANEQFNWSNLSFK